MFGGCGCVTCADDDDGVDVDVDVDGGGCRMFRPSTEAYDLAVLF